MESKLLFKDWRLVLVSEIKNVFSPINILVILVLNLLILPQILLQNSDNFSGLKIVDYAIGLGASYSMGATLYKQMVDKASIDKNIISFLRFPERKVLFSKLFASTLYALSIVFVSFILSIITYSVREGQLISVGEWGRAILFCFCFMIMIFFIIFLARTMLALPFSKPTTYILAGVVITFTAVLFLIMSFISYVPIVNTWLKDNMVVVASIPILNIASFNLYFQNIYDQIWTTFPELVYMITTIIVLFEFSAKKIKTFLVV
ncbi:MAG: hypothetical protein NC236_02470 [Mycoplasma sp.]|nr:hypothetical protein [Mycoplasma sp.]